MRTRLQTIYPLTHQPHGLDQQPQATGKAAMWLSSEQARELLGVETRKAVSDWCRYHGVVRRNDGSICRRDLERELSRPRRHRMALASLANLERKTV